MKRINAYITEKFRLRDDSKISGEQYGETDDKDPGTRVLRGDEISIYNGAREKLTIPNRCWYVFRDQYRFRQYKIECYSELAANMMYAHDDYESFGPQDVLYATNNLKDAMLWVVSRFVEPGKEDKLNDLFTHSDCIDEEDWVDELYGIIKSDYRASFNFNTVYQVLTGDIKPIEFMNPQETKQDFKNKVNDYDGFKQFIETCGYETDD